MWLRLGSSYTPPALGKGCRRWGHLLGVFSRDCAAVPSDLVGSAGGWAQGSGEPARSKAPLTFCRPQLPVPVAVLYLMSKERLLTCCPQRRPLLLSADELALETRPPEKEDPASLPPNIPHLGGGASVLPCSQPHTEAPPVTPPQRVPIDQRW